MEVLTTAPDSVEVDFCCYLFVLGFEKGNGIQGAGTRTVRVKGGGTTPGPKGCWLE